jgi:integrase
LDCKTTPTKITIENHNGRLRLRWVHTAELFHRFTLYQSKEKGLEKRSLSARYSPLERHLEKSLNIAAYKVTKFLAGNFVALQLDQVSSQTAKERIWLLQSCWEWAKGRYQIAESNPWSSHILRIKPT